MSETPIPERVENCLDRIRQGDAAARDELIAVAYEPLRRLAHQMLRDFPRVRRLEETTDVLHNALLRLHRALIDVPMATAIDFFRVAALQIRRELRDLARHYYGPQGQGARHDSGPPPEGEAPSTNDPGKLQLWGRFHQAVEKLPDEEREVFHLRWYLELSAAEAAEALAYR